MPSSRGCRSSYDCIVKIKGVTTRPILFSQLMRSDGEGAMIPSEIKLLDEVKDTVDTSQTMEFLLSEILETPAFIEKRKALYAEADEAIASSLPEMNKMLEEVLSLNGSERTKDFIAPNPKRAIKNLVSIGQDDVKIKDGQRTDNAAAFEACGQEQQGPHLS